MSELYKIYKEEGIVCYKERGDLGIEVVSTKRRKILLYPTYSAKLLAIKELGIMISHYNKKGEKNASSNE